MRDMKALRPDLQEKITLLQKKCAAAGITIGIGECLRTKAEQDALYAQGRTKPGKIVTNAKGSSYSSMHQWGVAFDFYLKMDVDGDGKTSDDAFNNSTGLYDKVGKIGQSIGLEWGGSWKSIKDRPHFQLPNWGSTPTKLKKMYGTPEKFMAVWKKSGQAATATKTEYKAGDWYRVKEAVPVCNGYYGEHGKYIYLSNQIKTSCDNKSGIGYLRKGADIKPVEVRKFDDGSVWFKLDATIAFLAVGVDGKVYIG